MLRTDLVHCPRTDDDRIYRRAEQSHNEAIRLIGTADRFTTGLARNSITDHAVDCRNKIAYHVRPVIGNIWKTEITSIELAEVYRKQRFAGSDTVMESSQRLYHWAQAAIPAEPPSRSIMSRNSWLKIGF